MRREIFAAVSSSTLAEQLAKVSFASPYQERFSRLASMVPFMLGGADVLRAFLRGLGVGSGVGSGRLNRSRISPITTVAEAHEGSATSVGFV